MNKTNKSQWIIKALEAFGPLGLLDFCSRWSDNITKELLWIVRYQNGCCRYLIYMCHNHHNCWLCKTFQSSVRFPIKNALNQTIMASFYTQCAITPQCVLFTKCNCTHCVLFHPTCNLTHCLIWLTQFNLHIIITHNSWSEFSDGSLRCFLARQYLD